MIGNGHAGSSGQTWKVGALARATGLTVRTLHYYDEIGLLPPSARLTGGHRLYDAADAARLAKTAGAGRRPARAEPKTLPRTARCSPAGTRRPATPENTGILAVGRDDHDPWERVCALQQAP